MPIKKAIKKEIKEEKEIEEKEIKETVAVEPQEMVFDDEKIEKKKAVKKTAKPPVEGKYYEAVGRRKTAVARVRLFTKGEGFLVNGKPYEVYFPSLELQKIAEDALKKMKLLSRFQISVKIFGGGIHSQAEALRHGLARVLTKFNPEFRKRLKRAEFLVRDSREKERRKFGLKKARRAPQWSKR